MKWREFEEFGEKVRITIYKLISQQTLQTVDCYTRHTNVCETREHQRQGCQVVKQKDQIRFKKSKT